MKIIHAIWEYRNLGVDCNEIIIEENDILNEEKNLLIDFETQYTVVKVPIEMIQTSFLLQSLGYKFIETMTSCYCKAELPVLSSIQKRIVDSVDYQEMNIVDKEQLFNEIDKGMFRNDRIALDPKFKQTQSNNRCKGWILDELKLGACLYKLTYKKNTIGFFLNRKKEEQISLSILSGIYDKYQKYGFGICANYYAIDEAIKNASKKIMTSFSSNNRAATSIHFSMNYILDKQYYVYVKHK